MFEDRVVQGASTREGAGSEGGDASCAPSVTGRVAGSAAGSVEEGGEAGPPGCAGAADAAPGDSSGGVADGASGAAGDGGHDGILGRLASVVPGGYLASVVEQLLEPLLAPAPAQPAGGAHESAAPEDAVWPRPVFQGALGEEALVSEVLGPGEQALLRAAAARELGPGGSAAADALGEVGAAVLVEVVAACDRLVSWARWAQALASACLARSVELRSGPAPWGPGGTAERFVTPEESQFTTSNEIACRLGVPRGRAQQLVERGEALLGCALAPTEALHRVGLVDEAKTAVVVGRLDGVSTEVARAVQAKVLPRAAHRTRAQLARDLDRALAAMDSDGAEPRRQRNIASRHVSRPRPAGEGVSEMRMLLPTPDAFLVDATLDAVAGSARAAGDGRCLSQLRADALVGLGLAGLRSAQQAAFDVAPVQYAVGSTGGAAAGVPGRAGGTAPAGASASPPGGGRGRSGPDAPGGGPGRGPGGVPGSLDDGGGVAGPTFLRCVGAEAPRLPGGPARLLPDGVPLEGLLAGLSDLVGSSSPWWTPSGGTAVFPPPGVQVRVDVTVPLDHLAGLLEDTPGPSPGETSGGGGALRGRAGHAAHGTGRRASHRANRETGCRADCADQAGRGGARLTAGGRSAPVPTVVARSLAAGGVWRRIVTDPLSGAVVDVGRSRYRPPAGLAELVRARDVTCVHPGCSVPARRCDLDHITPWSQGGVTSLENLAVLCQAHHRLKHTPGWSLRRAAGGALVWRTPSGARYRREADGTIVMLPRRIGPRHFLDPGGPVPDTLAAAVDAAVVARLERGLDRAGAASQAVGAGPGRVAEPAGSTPTACFRTWGPRPGQRAGAFEAVPYPEALHALGLAALLDEVPPWE